MYTKLNTDEKSMSSDRITTTPAVLPISPPEFRRAKRVPVSIWRRSPDWLYPVAAVLLMLVVWHLVVVIFEMPPYLLPKPANVLLRTIADFRYLAIHTWVTTYETLGGFALSVIIGIPLAMAIVASPVLDRALMPLLVLSQTFPKVAIAPLLIIWFGLGVLPKLIIGFLVAFFPVVISTVVGLRSMEAEMIELARSMRVSAFKMFWMFRLPNALPNVFAGLKVAIAFAVVGAVIGEWVGSTEGLGYLLLKANADLDAEFLFAIMLMLMVIGIVLFYAIELIERALIPWHVSVRLPSTPATM
jgi:NitT/TauT family transport system permease protein